MNITENIWHAKNYYHNVSTCICLSRRKTGLAETAVLQGFETTTFYSLKCGYGLKMDLRERRRGEKNDLSLQTALSSSSLSSTGNLHWQIQWLITTLVDANGKIPRGIQWEKDQTPNLDCCQQWGANVSVNRASLVSFLPQVSSIFCQLRVESRLFRAREESGRAGFAKPVEFEAVWTSWNIYQLCRTGDWLLQASSLLTSGQGSSLPLLWLSRCEWRQFPKCGTCVWSHPQRHSLGWVSRRRLSDERGLCLNNLFWSSPQCRGDTRTACPGFPCSCMQERSFPNALTPVTFAANKVISEGTRRVLFSLQQISACWKSFVISFLLSNLSSFFSLD